jgi:hypothetical protein
MNSCPTRSARDNSSRVRCTQLFAGVDGGVVVVGGWDGRVVADVVPPGDAEPVAPDDPPSQPIRLIASTAAPPTLAATRRQPLTRLSFLLD